MHIKMIKKAKGRFVKELQWPHIKTNTLFKVDCDTKCKKKILPAEIGT